MILKGRSEWVAVYRGTVLSEQATAPSSGYAAKSGKSRHSHPASSICVASSRKRMLGGEGGDILQGVIGDVSPHLLAIHPDHLTQHDILTFPDGYFATFAATTFQTVCPMLWSDHRPVQHATFDW